MTGLEVVGALASIAQVGAYTISIIASIRQVYGTLQAAPARLHRGCEELDRLSETLVQIQHNPALQTNGVMAHARNLAQLIESLEGMLKDMLANTKKSKLKRAAKMCLGSQEEQRLVEAFAQIESGKSALILSINVQATNETSSALGTLVGEVPLWKETNSDVKSIRILMLTILGKLQAPWATHHQAAQKFRLADTISSNPRDNDKKGNRGCYNQLGSDVYENVKSTDEARQLNGNVDRRLESGCRRSQTRYINIVASGKSKQLNGHVSPSDLSSFFSNSAYIGTEPCH